MIVATTNDLTGHRIVRHIGMVRGVTVRSRNVISDAIGGVQSMIGGRVGAYVKLAEAARNAPLVSFQRSLVSQTSLIIAQYESSGRSHCSYDEHNQLIDAIEARDAERAVHLMMHHMDHIDSKLNLDEESASDDLHAVFSHLLQTKKKPGRSAANR